MMVHPEAQETRAGWVWLEEQNIIRFRAKPGIDQTADDARVHTTRAQEIMGPERYRLVVDFRGSSALSREARAEYSRPEVARGIMAMAVLVDTTGSRILGNLFITLNRGKIPTRIFTDESLAIAWLKRYS
jgi:hypothetical protein